MNREFLRSHFGVSTLWMDYESSDGISIFDAIKMVKRADFKAIEIVPGTLPRGKYPHDHLSVGFYYDDVSDQFLGRLAEALDDFSMITVHSPHVDLNVASLNKGIRKESIRQYIQCIELANKIGAQVVTFHHGGSNSGYRPNLDDIIEMNVNFGIRSAELAERYDLQMGYEVLGGAIADKEHEFFKRTLKGINSDRFGINLDIGHVNMVSGGSAIDWAKDFPEELKEIHLHGTYYRSDRRSEFITHSPLSMEEIIEIPQLLNCLEQSGFEGPIITEIHAPDIQSYLEVSKDALNILKSNLKD